MERLQLCRCRVVRFCITVDIVRDGGRRNAGVQTCAVRPLPWNSSVTGYYPVTVPHASAQPSAATASAIISSGRDGSVASAAASSVQPSAASSAGACRSRASITATSTSSRCKQQRRLYRLRPLLRLCTRARSGVHMQQGLSVRRLVPGRDSIIIAQHSPLRGYSTHTHWCSALVRQRLGGVGGGAPVHALAQRQRTPAQQATNRPSPRDDARAA